MTTAPSGTASARMPAHLARRRAAGRWATSARAARQLGQPVHRLGERDAGEQRQPARTGRRYRRPAALGPAAPGRSRTLVAMPARAGDTQSRPRRPRPAVCRSATTTRPSGSPARAASAASAFVEPVSTRRSIRVQRASGRSGRAAAPGRPAAGGRGRCTASRAPRQPTARRAAVPPAGGPARQPAGSRPGSQRAAHPRTRPRAGTRTRNSPEVVLSARPEGTTCGELRAEAARAEAADRAPRAGAAMRGTSPGLRGLPGLRCRSAAERRGGPWRRGGRVRRSSGGHSVRLRVSRTDAPTTVSRTPKTIT